MTLPRFVVIKESSYNNKYLCLRSADEEDDGLLQCSGEDVLSLKAKFEVQMAKSGNGMVHIRCCYNNKYWVRRSADESCIVAKADEPEEDQSKWSCTLFEPIYADSNATRVRFRNIHEPRLYVCVQTSNPVHDACLYIDENDHYVYTIIDWEALLIWPKHVEFKSNKDCYMGGCCIKGHTCLECLLDDFGDAMVDSEVFNNGDRSICIEPDRFCRFWRRSSNWILAHSDTCFWPIRVDDNVLTFLNLGNKNFFKILSTEARRSCLNTAVSTITREACLQLVEFLLSRKIHNVNFRLNISLTLDVTTNIKACFSLTKGSCDVPFSYSLREMDDGLYTGIN